jgi:uncharacterized protein YyaL (SSP411 family)
MNKTNSGVLIPIRNLNTVFFLLVFLCSCSSKKQNHLSKASSPYLLEHADNPVDWYEWGEEPLQLAKKENKPLLISVGYSACHWCHMMEKESFMDTAVARIMNENFICIKVDREERPDIDNIYTNACQLISSNAGWPLNAFALADGKPFYAGTYYSKATWISLLKQIATAYKNQNNKVVLQAQTLSRGIATLEFSVLTDSIADIANKTTYQNLFDNLYRKMDVSFGGLSGTPKFPNPSALEFLMQYYFLTKDKRAIDVVTTTLTRMALGGIYDQIGGGFSRYSTDSLWHIPHFEKMLYDNAQLLSVYAYAYQLTGNEFFKNIVKETGDFIQRDLNNSNNGYYSSLNADTKDGEGEFYSWTSAELQNKLSKNYGVITNYYNVSANGNWKENKNVLFASETPDVFAQKNNIEPTQFLQELTETKQTLLAYRNNREKPTADDKVLTSWNALLMKGFVDAYAAIGDQSYLQKALSIAQFFQDKIIKKDGSVWRNYKGDKTSIGGFLDDYAFLSKAFIRLYQISFDKHWLDLSKQLADYAIKNFYDPSSGMFFYTEHRSDRNIIQKIELTDNAIPSSNAVMVEVLYVLGVYLENEDYIEKSKRMFSKLYGQLQKEGASFYASWCYLAGWFSYGTNEVAIVGNEAINKNAQLQKVYLPMSLFLGSIDKENLPLLEEKKIPGKTFIYVCTNKTCKLPVEATTKAIEQLINEKKGSLSSKFGGAQNIRLN